MKRISLSLLSASVLLLPALAMEPPGSAAPLPGMYSSLANSQRSGDVVGMELFVVPGGNSLHGVLQGSEGAPGTPIVVPLQASGSSVRFSVPPNCSCALPQGDYTAQLSRSGAKVRGPREFGERQLARTVSYWQGR
jgi:hypothetical protein